jgi:hypothetical protein
MKMILGNIVGCFHKTQETNLYFKHPIPIIKCKEINRQNKGSFIFSEIWGVLQHVSVKLAILR